MFRGKLWCTPSRIQGSSPIPISPSRHGQISRMRSAKFRSGGLRSRSHSLDLVSRRRFEGLRVPRGPGPRFQIRLFPRRARELAKILCLRISVLNTQTRDVCASSLGCLFVVSTMNQSTSQRCLCKPRASGPVASETLKEESAFSDPDARLFRTVSTSKQGSAFSPRRRPPGSGQR